MKGLLNVSCVEYAQLKALVLTPVFAAKHLFLYVKGQPFIIKTGQLALKCLPKQKDIMCGKSGCTSCGVGL